MGRINFEITLGKSYLNEKQGREQQEKAASYELRAASRNT